MEKEIVETKCPDCSNKIRTYEGYQIWCYKCEWNLSYQNTLQPKTKLEEFYKKISQKHGKSLFEKIKNENLELELRKVTYLRIIVFIISITVISLNILLLLSSIYFIVYKVQYYEKFIGLLLLAIFYLSKPKRRKLPKEQFVSKQTFSELYKLVNQICVSLKTTPVKGIIINEEFNAGISEYGLLRKKVLYIGLPLWQILSNDERLALLGHEISHSVNNDPLRSKIVGTAINILIDTGKAIYPGYLAGNLADPFIGELESLILWLSKILIIPVNLLLRGISNLLFSLAYILSQMIWIDSQRAEYLADLLGSSISGSTNAVKLMEKLGYDDILSFETQNLALKGKKEIEKTNLFDLVKNKIDNFPDHEKERVKRLQSKEEHRLDLKHPPTYFRIQMLNDKGYKNIRTGEIYTKIDFHKIKSECKNYESKIQDKLIDLHRNSLYY